MKRFFQPFFIILFIFTLCLPLSAKKCMDAKQLSEELQAACPTEFGYVDNSEYYMSNYFSSLQDVDDFHIVTCADSTNFSEIGVFHMKDTSHLSLNQKLLKKYLAKIKKNFETGVVYNTKEYPKFENAKTFAKGNYLVYVVLDKPQVSLVEATLRSLIQ